MSVINLIQQLNALNISIKLVDGKLKIQAPAGVLTNELKNQLRDYKPQLIKTLEQAQAQKQSKQQAIGVVDRTSELPLSFAQQRMWLLNQIEPESSAYHLNNAFMLRGNLDFSILQRAINALVQRHEILRTVYQLANDESEQPTQRIIDVEHIEIDVYQDQTDSLVSFNANKTKVSDKVLAWLNNHANRPFDLTQDTMLRVQVVSVSNDDSSNDEKGWVIQWVVHHIAVDAWSMGILSKEFIMLYQFAQDMPNANAATLAQQLPTQALQYADFAHWQRDFLQGDKLTKQLNFWRKNLATESGDGQDALILPTKNHSSKKTSSESTPERINFTLDGALSARIQSLAESNPDSKTATSRVTPHVFMLSALQKLLHDYSGQNDIRVGVPTANRHKAEIQPLVGCFVNTLVMKAEFDQTQSVAEYLGRCQQQSLDAQDNQDVPFEMLVDELVTTRNMNSSPLFQVMFNYLQQDQSNKVELNDVTFEAIELNPQAVKFNLALLVQSEQSSDGNHVFNCTLDYDGSVFSTQFIQQFIIHYQALLQGFVEAIEQQSPTPLHQVSALSNSERQQQLVEFNNTDIEFSDSTPLTECYVPHFERCVEQYTERTALTFEGQSLTYRELNKRANQLADYLITEHNVRPDSLVALCVERSIEMVVGILGILKAGGAYVPLDPSYPDARLGYILDDTKVSIVLTQSHLASRIKLTQSQVEPGHVICLDSLEVQSRLENYRSENRDFGELGLLETNLAYVIYTSGSTGNPKGVMIEHRALINRLDWMHREYGCGVSDVILQKTPFSFDVSVWEFTWPLMQGARLVLAKPEGHKDPHYLSEVIQREAVTKMHFVPSMLAVMLANNGFNNCNSVKQIFCSGEALSRSHVETLLSNYPWIELHNLYGPTEAAIDVSFWNCQASLNSNALIPIGRPIQNIQLHVLDSQLNLLPVGAIGELHIAGVGLARGYLNQDELTQEKFIANPFSDSSRLSISSNFSISSRLSNSSRLYKTGDLARWRADGVIEYLGRLDDQVKVRGFRIELGEIEAALSEQATISETVVIARDEPKRLIAYVVQSGESKAKEEGGEQQKIEQIRSQLSLTLPEHMVPSVIMLIDSIPLTANGKVNRRALPEPDQVAGAEYLAPATQTQQLLCDIWQDILGVQQVGINDNFFELGGHSLLVIRVITRLQEHGINGNVRDLFTSPCLKDLSLALDSNASKEIFRAPERRIPEGCENITPDMLPLLELSQDDINLITSFVTGGTNNILDIYPLGPLQEGIYFHHVMSEVNDPYVFPNLLKVDSRTNLDKLLDAVQFIINRHDVLRTMVLSEDLPQAVQVVCKKVDLPVIWLDFGDTENNIEEKMHAMAEGDQWLDVTQAPLLRVNVAQDGDRFYVLLQYHHLISDHEGLAIIQREIMAYFSNLSNALPTPIAYREFVAHAQHQREHGDAKKFFSDMLSDIDEATLPFGLTNTKNDGSRIIDYRQKVDAEVATRVRSLAKSMQINPASLFHAAWALVISACSGRESVVFGSVLSGRLQGTVGAEHMMGVFINTLPIRVDVDQRSVRDYVASVHQSLTNLLSYEQAPLVLAQNCSAVASEQPLFSALMNYRHSQGVDANTTNEKSIDGIEFVSAQVRNNYPLTLSVDDYGDQGFGLAGLFDESIDADRLLAYIQRALALITEDLGNEDVNQAINQLSVLSEQETQSLLSLETSVEQIEQANVASLFELQVKQSAEYDALVFNQQRISYQTLNEQTNRLAHYLHAQGVSVDTPVALYMDRSPSLIISILAVLKAGGCYLPLDTQWPSTRIAGILKDANVSLLLSEGGLSNQINEHSSLNIVCVDKLQQFADYSSENLDQPTKSSDAAYIIYTSGSTGEPKGVVIEHRQLLNYINGINERLNIAGMSFAHISTVAADLGNTSLFGALCLGGALHLIDADTAFDADKTAKLLQNYPVDALKIVPGHLQGLLQAAENAQSILPTKLLIVGGETCSIDLIQQIKKLSPELRIVNHYGPSETTVGVLTHDISEEDIQAKTIPIGKPLANTQTLIFDTAGKLAPIGVVGELYIGGASVARGYLNRAELTAQRFINFHDNQSRIYRTGDRVRLRTDGTIEFLGRVDNQVKVRGYRVELGDIESCLLNNLYVSHATVLLIDSDVNQQLVAYLQFENSVDKAQQDTSLATIKEQLSQTLPDYMQPQQLVVLESIPRTSNGKVDRRALIESGAFNQNAADDIKQFVEPRNETEALLFDIWCQVLQRETVSTHDDFFAIGGDSILSLQVIARAKKQGLKLTPRVLFDQPSIAQLAEHAELISDQVPVGKIEPLTGSVLLTPIQRWFFEANQPQMHHWNQSVMFNVLMPLDINALQQASLALINHHDGLRLSYENFCDQWSQHYADLKQFNADTLCHHISATDLDLDSSSSSEQISAAIENKADQLQRSLDLENGEVIRLAYFSLSEIEGQTDRLLIAIHHLAVDGVSWRIMVNDLYQLYQQALLQKPFDLGSKNVSFQQWATHLTEYAQSSQVIDEIDYWRSSFDIKEDASNRLLSINNFTKEQLESNTVATQETVSFSLSLEQTSVLLKDAPSIYDAQINDLLLSALVAGLCEKGESILLEMEGHGREMLAGQGDLDLSQTVGWFTSRFPLKLDNVENYEGQQTLIDQIKKQLSEVPNKGIGYGVIRYLHDNFLVQDEFSKHHSPLISFNYLGQFDGAIDQAASGLLSAAKESAGQGRAEVSKRSQLLGIVGQVSNQCLQITLQFSNALHQKTQIQSLVDQFHHALLELIKDCVSQRPSQEELSTNETPTASTDQQQSGDVSIQQLQLIREAEGVAESPVFCLHHRGGHTREYKQIAEHFSASVPVYGIQSPALSDPHYNEQNMTVVARNYADLIQSVQPQGNYRLLGWSLGGVLAMAITEVLEERGHKVTFLGLIDAMLPQSDNNFLYQSDSLLDNLLAVFGAQAVQRYAQVDQSLRDMFEKTLLQLNEENALQFACDWIVKSGMVDSEVFDEEYLKLHYRTAVQSKRLIQSFKPKKSTAKVNVWWAKNSLNTDNNLPPTDWQQYCAGILSEQVIEGGHFDIVQDAGLKQSVAQRIAEVS